MKCKFIYFLLFSAPFTIMAQEYKYIPFPDSNAVWSEIHWKPIFDPPPSWVYNKYALFNEDTVINGIKYSKLFHTNSTSKITRENSTYIGGIREDSLKRVFVYYDKTYRPNLPYYKGEFLLYRFNLNIGDTIWQYKEHIHILPLEFLTVKSIDTIKVHNTMRKVYSFDPVSWVYWIEGIGNVKGLIFTSGDLPTNGMNNDLICMHQNDTLMFFNHEYNDCVPYFVIDGLSLLANPDVRIYPNPVKNGIVHFENIDFETLELFDLNGNLIQQENIKGLSVFELKIPSLPAGAYTYQLKTKGLVPTQGKLVVQ